MARPIAADHDEKRRAILKAAARLFASQGFDRASMAEIALACRVSKALLYHYYASKDQLLFDIIRAHLDDLVAACDPLWMQVTADWKARGGINSIIRAEHTKAQ
jgi:AcrR family transcriptional regulator